MKSYEELTEKELLERLRAYMTFRRYLNPSLIDFIDQVQSYEYIPQITKVAEDMDVHASTVWKFMNFLKNKGLRFLGIIDLSRINAEEITLIFDNYIPYDEVFKGLLREYAPLLPVGTYLKYIVPKGSSEAFLNELLTRFPKEPRTVLRMTYTHTGKPNLKKYFDISSKEIIIDWDEIYELIKTSPKESVPKEVRRKTRFDIIDLFILRKLEVSPLDSLRKITEELNRQLNPITPINYIRVLRHYKNHIEARGVVRGVKIDPTPLYPIDTLPTKIMISGNPAELLRIIKVLTTHPYIPEASLNSSDSVGLLSAYIPLSDAFEFSLFLESLKEGGFIRDWKAFYFDYQRHRRLALSLHLHGDSVSNVFRLDESSLLVEEITTHLTLPSLDQLMRARKDRRKGTS